MKENKICVGPTKDDIAWYLKVIADQKKEIQRLQVLKGGNELKALKKENLRLRQKLDMIPTNVDLSSDAPKPLFELVDGTGLSLYALSKISDVPNQNLKHIIDDGANVRIDTAMRIVDALGLTLNDVAWLVGRANND